MDLKNKNEETLIPLSKKYLVTAQTKIAFSALCYQLDQKPYIYKYYVNEQLGNDLIKRGCVITLYFPYLRNIKKARLYHWLSNTIYKYGFCEYPSNTTKELTLVFVGVNKSNKIKKHYQNKYDHYLLNKEIK